MKTMEKISAVALFCEDIRHELKGLYSLIGVLPAGIIVSSDSLSRMAISVCVRITVDTAWNGGEVNCLLLTPGGGRHQCGTIDNADLAEIRTAGEQGEKSFIIVLTSSRGLSIKDVGILKVVLEFQNKQHIIGELDIVLNSEA